MVWRYVKAQKASVCACWDVHFSFFCVEILTSIRCNPLLALTVVTLQGLLYVTDGELRDAGIEDATHRETILTQLSRDRQRLDPLSGQTQRTHTV